MFSIYMTEPFDSWVWESYLAPIHFALLGVVEDERVINHIMMQMNTNDYIIKLNLDTAISHLGKLLKYTEFVSKHRLYNQSEFNSRRRVVKWIEKKYSFLTDQL